MNPATRALAAMALATVALSCFADPDVIETGTGSASATGTDAGTSTTTSVSTDTTGTTSTGTSSSASSSGDATTGDMRGCDAEANLLTDGSFENWLSGTLVDWQNGPQLEQVTTDVVEGDSAARVISSGYDELRQDIQRSFPDQACFQVCVSVRYDEGHETPPDLLLQGNSDAGADNQFITADWEPDGSWHRVEAGLQLQAPASYAVFSIVSNDDAGQEIRFSVDDAILNYLGPC